MTVDLQVIAPLLIILRVADKSALTSNTVASGRINSFKAPTRGGSRDDSGALPGGDPTSSGDEYVASPGELWVGVENGDINPHQDKI